MKWLILLLPLLFYGVHLPKGKVFTTDITYFAGNLPEVTITGTRIHVPTYTENELHRAARCVCGEARGESIFGQVAVANVILNRMRRHDRTILQVIYRPGQFDGAYFRKALPSCRRAVEMVFLKGIEVLPPQVYYFANHETSTDKGWIKRLTDANAAWGKIGLHVFYFKPSKKKKRET